jgi:branched-chain amino acid transport system ATP-binding protein
MSLLEIRGLTAGYNANPVLRDCSVALDAGELVTLVGANGAGKSTLVKSISGLVSPMDGQIVFDGETISSLSPASRLQRGIAHVPEGRQIFASMTIRENLLLGAYATRRAGNPETKIDEICGWFPMLKPRLGELAGNLSGGQQQLLAIARGLMSEPRLLLLDEPSLGIAPLLVTEIFRLIASLRDRGIAILMAEQNARQALMVANRGYVVEGGRITLGGEARDLLSSHDIVERYLGSSESAQPNADSTALTNKLRGVLEPHH